MFDVIEIKHVGRGRHLSKFGPPFVVKPIGVTIPPRIVQGTTKRLSFSNSPTLLLLEVQIRSLVVLARHGGLFDVYPCSSADSYSATGRTAKKWSRTGGYRECNASKSYIQSQQPLSK